MKNLLDALYPFFDGNKRTSLVSAELFLNLNGVEFATSDEEVVLTWLALAAGESQKPNSNEFDFVHT